jgi:glutamate--cysteine ligase
MAARSPSYVLDLQEVDPAVATPITSIDEAHAYVAAGALRPSTIGTVGLELEMHVVDRARPDRRISWGRLLDVVAVLPPMPGGSTVTVEPGGQLELSTPPQPDVAAALDALAGDHQALAGAIAAERLALVAVGTDLSRPVQRLSPKSRYVAMEAHFAATGSGDAGRAMMCSTAALQLNLDAGPAHDWPDRVSHMHRLAPVLVAISACSAWLAGEASGWRSMRQQIWGEIDQARCGPLLDGRRPDEEWASYALAAPVMLLLDRERFLIHPVEERVTFAEWVREPTRLGRTPTIDDLDYHLSTLFPPIRPRGYLEIRCVDAVPRRWWPGLAGIAVTLLDDPVAADRAAKACEQIDDGWTAAARDGLSDPVIARAARRCVGIAVDRAPASLASQIAEYAELVCAGKTPGDEIDARVRRNGPSAVLASLAAEAVGDA